MNNKEKNSGNLFIVVLLAIVVVAVFFFPKINEYIVKITSPKIESKKVEKEEKKEFNENILEDIHFPNMRTNIYSSLTYYSLDKFSISDMKNNDILVAAFLDVHPGNIVALKNNGKCGAASASLDQKYLVLRIKNILGRNTNYKLENFVVPEGTNSKYAGNWTYNAATKKFVYEGICNKNTSQTKYYDLKQLKEGKYEGNDLILYYYVGFVKVEGGKYTIYSQPDMKNEISNGEFIDLDTLQNTFENINNKQKKIYKFIFRNNICTYNEYCLYEGSWD